MKDKIFIALQNFDLPNPIMDYGLQLGKSMNMHCTLVGIISVPTVSSPVDIVGDGAAQPRMAMMSDVQDHTIRQLEKLIISGKKEWRYLDYQVQIGFPEPKLVAATEREEPFLTILEQNNDSSFLNEWFGTYETRLAEKINAPTLIVPQETTPDRVMRIMYILDEDAYEKGNIGTLTEIMKRTGAKLDVAIRYKEDTLNPKSKFIINRIETKIHPKKVHYHQILPNNIEGQIEILLQKLKPTWLCINFKEQSFWDYLTNRRISERLVLETDVPVLVI